MDQELAPELSERMHLLALDVPGVLVPTTCARGCPAPTGSSSCIWTCLASSASRKPTPSARPVEDWRSAAEFPRAEVLVYADPHD